MLIIKSRKQNKTKYLRLALPGNLPHNKFCPDPCRTFCLEGSVLKDNKKEYLFFCYSFIKICAQFCPIWAISARTLHE